MQARRIPIPGYSIVIESKDATCHCHTPFKNLIYHSMDLCFCQQSNRHTWNLKSNMAEQQSVLHILCKSNSCSLFRCPSSSLPMRQPAPSCLVPWEPRLCAHSLPLSQPREHFLRLTIHIQKIAGSFAQGSVDATEKSQVLPSAGADLLIFRLAYSNKRRHIALPSCFLPICSNKPFFIISLLALCFADCWNWPMLFLCPYSVITL